MAQSPRSIESWTNEAVCDWLQSYGCPPSAVTTFQTMGLSGQQLKHMDEKAFNNLGIPPQVVEQLMNSLAARKTSRSMESPIRMRKKRMSRSRSKGRRSRSQRRRRSGSVTEDAASKEALALAFLDGGGVRRLGSGGIEQTRGIHSSSSPSLSVPDAVKASNQASSSASSPSGAGGKSLGKLNATHADIDLSVIEVQEKISSAGASNTTIFSVTIDGWRCAMKELPVSFMTEADVKKLLLEIETLRALPPHANVIRYLHHTYTRDSLRLFTTLYTNTLAQQLRDWKLSSYRPQLDSVVHMALDIVKGLTFLHKNGIVHRDIKSPNIFVIYTPRRTVKRLVIGDFDSCKNISATAVATTTIGTPGWMAPEVLSNKPYNQAADIWGFGIVLFELMTLEIPYDGLADFDVLDRVRKGEPPALPNALPQDIQTLLPLWKSCLANNPNERPSDELLFRRLCSALT